MHRVGVDGIGKVSADGARGGFFRVGSSHQVTVLSNCVFTFKYLHNDGAGGHKAYQMAKEGALGVFSIEAFGLCF